MFVLSKFGNFKHNLERQGFGDYVDFEDFTYSIQISCTLDSSDVYVDWDYFARRF